MSTNVNQCSFETLKDYYNNNLNKDKSTYKSSNDEPTPIDCIEEMMQKLPEELWNRKDLKILDPCCGNGNFHLPIYFMFSIKDSLCIYFVDYFRNSLRIR